MSECAASSRILLSVPHMGGSEQTYVQQAFATNWLSTVGPNITAFEKAFAERVGLPAVALASGTAGLHLALRLAGVGSGNEVFCSSLTFVAAANAIVYQGGVPVFVDSDRATWNLDPDVLSRALRVRAAVNRLPKALVVVHLYGQSADMDPILHACAEYGVAVIEDAAEAVGTLYKGKPAGTLGDVGVYSFNGNKIITTTGGGMLVSRNAAWVEKARFWSQQARDPGLCVRTLRTRLQLPHEQRAGRHRPRPTRSPRPSRPTAARHRVPLSRCLRRPSRHLAHAPGPLRPAHQLAELLPHRRRRSSVARATNSSAPWMPRTSSPAPSGSRCTSSRCMPAASATAARWPRTCSAAASVSEFQQPLARRSTLRDQRSEESGASAGTLVTEARRT